MDIMVWWVLSKLSLNLYICYNKHYNVFQSNKGCREPPIKILQYGVKESQHKQQQVTGHQRRPGHQQAQTAQPTLVRVRPSHNNRGARNRRHGVTGSQINWDVLIIKPRPSEYYTNMILKLFLASKVISTHDCDHTTPVYREDARFVWNCQAWCPGFPRHLHLGAKSTTRRA